LAYLVGVQTEHRRSERRLELRLARAVGDIQAGIDAEEQVVVDVAALPASARVGRVRRR
jgi:hypothetical protein